ncbi:DUF2243 domain-containing protein [Loktanella sp. DJP18]|uniref:DUF2243 domain-containing protein n=1 Tax=Loktanella sp. DJP18 TaxID=3409788 RepID=UPI003BB563DE
MDKKNIQRRFPLAGGIFLGLGVGGFFDGIVLHQIRQWHHMATSAGLPVDGASPSDALANLKLNSVLDGLFHATAYIFVLIGLVLLWRAARKPHVYWSSRCLTAAHCRSSDTGTNELCYMPWSAGKKRNNLPKSTGAKTRLIYARPCPTDGE